MTKPKVYLAKSNKANPNLVSRVRQDLSNFNIDVIEYTGGTYTHKPLLECNLLIVVPDLSDKTNNSIIIGKGLYEQINLFVDEDRIDDILVINKFDGINIFANMVEDLYVDDTKDYINYGVLTVFDGDEILVDVLDEAYFYAQIDIKDSVIETSENKYQYLLIKR
jgi:hypothetical protein